MTTLELRDKIAIECLKSIMNQGVRTNEYIAKVSYGMADEMIKARGTEIYTESDLVSFGNYLLSEERKESIINEQVSQEVTDADLQNWKG